MNTIEIPIDTYIAMLEDRKKYVEDCFDWTKMQDFPALWKYALSIVEDCGVSPENTDPKYFVDNLIINGHYGSFDDFKERRETDEEFIYRVKDRAIFIDEEERSVAFSL